MQGVRLDFLGYTWEDYIWQVPQKKSIILVYEGGLDAEGFVSIEKLLYIDYNSLQELYSSEMMRKIKESMEPNQMLFFSTAEIDESDALGVRDLLVFAVKPQFNDIIPFNAEITVENHGNCKYIPSKIKSKV